MPKGQRFKPGTVKRLMSYLEKHRLKLAVVVICILVSSGASVASSLFLQTLIDDYIQPLLMDAAPVFGGLLRIISAMAAVFIAGVVASLFYSRTMAVMAQSVLKEIRDEMFIKMQSLPIRYFDTNSHGGYNELLHQRCRYPQTDDLTEFAKPVFIHCINDRRFYLHGAPEHMAHPHSAGVTGLILMVIKKIASKSGKYFMEQQRSIGDVNGYIEEMINGRRS